MNYAEFSHLLRHWIFRRLRKCTTIQFLGGMSLLKNLCLSKPDKLKSHQEWPALCIPSLKLLKVCYHSIDLNSYLKSFLEANTSIDALIIQNLNKSFCSGLSGVQHLLLFKRSIVDGFRFEPKIMTELCNAIDNSQPLKTIEVNDATFQKFENEFRQRFDKIQLKCISEKNLQLLNQPFQSDSGVLQHDADDHRSGDEDDY